jgi:hypothetical protein
MDRIVAAVLLVLASGCVADPKRSEQMADPGFRSAHLACHQRMMASSTMGWGMTPNRHIYLMCMKDKGFDV